MNTRLISDTQLNVIATTLKAVHLALVSSHNLTVTDRPDLPREEWPVYVLDHFAEIRAVGSLLDFLQVVISTDNGHVSDFGNKNL